MASSYQPFNIPVAASGNNHFNLNCNHITTTDFTQLCPVYYRDLVLGDSISVKMDVSVFTAPLVVPPMGVCHVKSRAFFVPYRIIWRHYNDFCIQHQVSNGIGLVDAQLPILTSHTFIDLFTTHDLTDEIYNYASSDDEMNQVVDFRYFYDSNNRSNFSGFRFTSKGRRIYKILRSLGYAWNWDFNIVKLNPLPLLSFFRAYLDFYIPSYHRTSSDINALLENVLSSSLYTITEDELFNCFEEIADNYDLNYFTAAWNSPNSPTFSQQFGTSFGSTFVPDDTHGLQNGVSADSYKTYLSNTEATYIQQLSQYGLNLLRAADSWLKRNNYSGAQRITDSLLARFGKRPANSKLDYAEFCGYDDTIIKWRQITNTSSSDGAELGSFGAQGFAVGDGKVFKYTAEEPGLFFILSSIVPETVYYHGIDKMCLQTEPLEFFNPEFEKLGCSPIRSAEIYQDADYEPNDQSSPDSPFGVAADMIHPEKIFGYAPNYANYKVPKDWITGDFTVNTLKQELSSWHFGREFNFRGRNDEQRLEALTPQTIAQYSTTRSQFNRIFNVTDDSADHFIEVFSFQVDAYRPMLSISDSLDISGNGRDVEMQPQGTRFD